MTLKSKVSRLPRAAAAAVKKLSKVVGNSAFYTHVVLLVCALERSRGHRKAPGPAARLVLAPPGGGNIGDQALLQSYLTNVTGDVVVLVRDIGNFDRSGFSSDRVRFVAMPHLLYSAGVRNLLQFRQFQRLLSNCSGFGIVGADIIDGAYNELASVNRIRTLVVARRADVPSRILGFSWNANPTPAVVREITEATRLGAELYLRDPQSHARMLTLHLPNTILTADMVFRMGSVNSSDSIPAYGDKFVTSDYVVINASGLVGKKVDQTDAYVEAVGTLRKLGYQVVLLPHVIRSTGDDAVACTQVHSALRDDEGVFLITQLLSPDDVQRLVSGAAFVMSGRMHLSVIALSAGIPAVTLATQGKVEGLMALFDLQRLAIAPSGDLRERMVSAATYCHENRELLAEAVTKNLPAVLELAALNFTIHHESEMAVAT